MGIQDLIEPFSRLFVQFFILFVIDNVLNKPNCSLNLLTVIIDGNDASFYVAKMLTLQSL